MCRFQGGPQQAVYYPFQNEALEALAIRLHVLLIGFPTNQALPGNMYSGFSTRRNKAGGSLDTSFGLTRLPRTCSPRNAYVTGAIRPSSVRLTELESQPVCFMDISC